MATPRDVRRIALSLPNVVELEDRFAFSVRIGAKDKGIAWVWLERKTPKGARVPNLEALGIRVENEEEKEMLIEAEPDKFFTEPHYNGYPAILVRLKAIGSKQLRAMLERAWKIQAPRKLVAEFESARPRKRTGAR